MDPLDFLPEVDLLKFFHCKKTEMSCMEEPQTFLNQLRDHNLVPEDLYKKVMKMKSKERRKNGVYDILDLLENEQRQCVKTFWSCMFHDHILQKYPVLRLLRNSLLDGSYKSQLPDTEEPNNSENESVPKREIKFKRKKGGGKRKKSVEQTEEEEEEPGPSSCSTPTRKKPSRRPTFLSPLKKGEKADIWTWDLYKTTLPVTCGDINATLYRSKLAKGIKCILYGGQWFTPGGFEKFAGKGSYKNWKLSIRCRKTPLQKLVQEGHLQCPRMKRKCVRKSHRVLFPVSSSESSSPASERSTETEGSSEGQEEEREREAQIEQEEGEEENCGSGEEEEESEPVDLSAFQAAVLPVSCGSVSGDLYKNRFTGSRSKSIRTEERWFSPEEFVKQELSQTSRHWKKDILCHGKSLHYLVERKILDIHSLLCESDCCAPKDPLAQNNDDVCFICDSDGDEDKKLVCCDECPRAFHQDCHLPTADDTLGDKWMCTFCVWKFNQQMWLHMSLEDTLNSPVTQNIMQRCEYLLLCLYKEDTKRMFTDDPFTTVPGYSSVITKSMWLNQVKTKLQRNKYITVRGFVDDIRLIFQNCQTLNQDSDFGMMGARLSEIFEQKFHIVFKIQ